MAYKKKSYPLVISVMVGLIIIFFIFIIKNTSFKNASSSAQSPTKNGDQPTPTPPYQEEQGDCPYNEKSLTEISSNDNRKLQMDEKNLEKWRKIPRDYIVELWKKGYHWIDILQLWEWKIPETDIPDLKAERRVGVIEELFYTMNMGKFDRNIPEAEQEKMPAFVGGNKSLVVIGRKIPHGGPKINLDRGIQTAAMGSSSDTRKYAEKVIRFGLQQENIDSRQYEISLLCTLGSQYFGKERNVAGGASHGKSFGSAIYLALLSALRQKAISQRVATTGALALGEKQGKTATYQDREEEMTKKIQQAEQELAATKTNFPNQTKTIKRLEKELVELKQKEVKLKAQIEQEKKIYPPIKGEEIPLATGTNLPISGLTEKVSGAYENGINILVLSKYNLAPYLLWQKLKNEQNTREWVLSPDYQSEVPPPIKNNLTVHLTENVKELSQLLSGSKLS